MQAEVFLSNNINVTVAPLDEDEEFHSKLLPGKILFGPVKAVFQCQPKDHKAAVAGNVCLGRNSVS